MAAESVTEEPTGLTAPEGFTVVKKCAECDEPVEEFDDPLYECGGCGSEFTCSENDSFRCQDCNRFAAKKGMTHDGCTGLEDDAVEALQCDEDEELFDTVEAALAHKAEHTAELEADKVEWARQASAPRSLARVQTVKYIRPHLHDRFIVEHPEAPRETIIIDLGQRTKLGGKEGTIPIPAFFAIFAQADGQLVTQQMVDSGRYLHGCGLGEAIPSFGQRHHNVATRAEQHPDGTVTLNEQLYPAQIAKGDVAPRTWVARPLPNEEYGPAIAKWALLAAKAKEGGA